jgi:hypothetical protein
MNEIEKAKAILREAGYFVDNLWTVLDVQDRYKCDNDTAQEILYESLTNEYIVEKIYSTITDICEEEGIEGIED